MPTAAEAGLPGYEVATWYAMWAPKGTPPEARKRLSDWWRALNNDAEMKDLAAKSGFELINVGVEEMDAFMSEKVKLYTDGAARLGLGKK